MYIVAKVSLERRDSRLTYCASFHHPDQSIVHVPRHLDRLHVAASIGRSVHTALDPSSGHTIGIQTFGIRDPGVLEGEGNNLGVSQRSARIHEGAVITRLDTVHQGISAERD